MGQKATQSSADQHTLEAVSKLVQQPILIINTAPFLRDPAEDEQHRGNTPWVIAIPFLRISFTAQRESGEPATGFYSDKEAEALARRVWEMCRSNPKVLADYRQNYNWPSTFQPGYKIMQRFITVEPFDPDA